MKTFRITWELVQEGVSELKARDLDDAKDKADDSVTDFGDPKQFTQITQWSEGWKVKTVEEVVEGEI